MLIFDLLRLPVVGPYIGAALLAALCYSVIQLYRSLRGGGSHGAL